MLPTYRQIALDVLHKHGKPFHYEKILELAISDGFKPDSKAKTPAATLNARISWEIKHKTNSPFIKFGGGIYGLRGMALPEPPINKPTNSDSEPESKQSDKQIVDNRITGKAGEHVVMGEMMFRGFNAHIPLVDKGIDIVVIKNKEVSHIQVKTANKLRSAYSHSIKIKSYKETAGRNTFYIFVLRDNNKCKFIILSSADMRKHIEANNIKTTKNGYYLVRFMPHEEDIWLGRRGGPSMQEHVDGWDILT